MKIFAPNNLIAVVQRIQEEHPKKGGATKGLLDYASVRELIQQISSKEMDELQGFASLLTNRDFESLAVFLGQPDYMQLERDTRKKICAVIGYGMTPFCYTRVFHSWTQNPTGDGILSVLGRHDNPENHRENIKVPSGMFRKWSGASEQLKAFALTCRDMGKGSCLSEKIESVGIPGESTLQKLGVYLLLVNGNAALFQQEGDTRIAGAIRSRTKEQQTAVIVRMLQTIKENEALVRFNAVCAIAKGIWREPDSAYFPKEFVGTEIQDRYRWWYNYGVLSQSLRGDARRITFWKRYLNGCDCQENTHHDMLIFRFKKVPYTAIEFKTMGFVYIFTNAYFESQVKAQMVYHNNTAAFKSWLHNSSVPVAKTKHLQNWEIVQSAELRRIGILAR